MEPHRAPGRQTPSGTRTAIRARDCRPMPHLDSLVAAFEGYASAVNEGTPMRKIIAIAAVTLSLISSQARADEHRGGDAALGALSGAVVFGPIGAVAGAVVGYSAGPSIAHAWGFRRSHSATRRARSARQEAPQAPETRAPATPQPAPAAPQAAPTAPQAVAPPAQHAPRTASSTLPPVQGFE
jgi:hypothetical protein